MNVHSSIFHNSQKVETTQIFISWWVDKQNVVYLDGGMLFMLQPWMNLENIMLS